MKILITGGSGLIGRNLKELTEGDGRHQGTFTEGTFTFVSSKDCNLISAEETEKMINTHNPEIVIHLAAKVGGLYDNMAHNATFLRDNLLINLNVFEACRKNGNVKKVISCLSTCIFPDGISIPISEEDLHKGPPHSSNYGYSYAKRLLETMSKAYNEEFSCPKFVTIIPTNIFGKYDNFNLERGHVIPALIHKCYLAKKNNTPLEIRGDGSALRQFIYAKDLAKLIIQIIENYHDSDPIILAQEQEYSIKEIVELITDIFEFKGEIKYDTSFSNGQHRKTVNNLKLKKWFPNFKFTELKGALYETIQWFKDQVKIEIRE